MNFLSNLAKARSHIAFVIGLLAAASIALSLETGIATSINAVNRIVIENGQDQVELAAQKALSAAELEQAQIAWRYFENNYQETTGLVNSVNNFPSTTIWDQASYLLALISAERIGIIEKSQFDERMNKVLITLSNLPLFDGILPNKVYHTVDLEMVNYANQAVERGIGWSALDVARMSVPLNIIVFDYPQHSLAASAILSNWNFEPMLDNGEMYGARVNEDTGETERVQEGRLGYEEYGARAIALLGLDAFVAGNVERFLRFEQVAGQTIAVDSRSYSEFDAHNYVVSEPYILTALEFGFDSIGRELADRLFKAQAQRYDETEILTAVSEDNIDQPPYFLYNTVFANGQAWNALAEDGSSHPDKRTVSTKAAFGWDVLFQNEYTNRLMEHIEQTISEDQGWYSGVYESDGRINKVATANTNAIILEALQYKANGPLVTSRFEGRLQND